MPFLLPTMSPAAYRLTDNIDEVFQWLEEAALGNRPGQMQSFLLNNNPSLFSPSQLRKFSEKLMSKTTPVGISLGDSTLGVVLNLLEVAAFKADAGSFEAFLEFYENFTGRSKNELISRQRNPIGYNLLHFAALNNTQGSKSPAAWIANQNYSIEAANALNAAGQLPIELAYTAHNMELLRPLSDVTTIIFEPYSEKYLNKNDLNPELKQIMLSMVKEKEVTLAAKKEIQALIKQFEILSKQTKLRLQTYANNQMYIQHVGCAAKCKDSIEKLKGYLNQQNLSLDVLERDESFKDIKKDLLNFGNEYPENSTPDYISAIHEVFNDLALLLRTTKGIAGVYSALEGCGYEGDLSFFTHDKFYNKSPEDTQRYLSDLIKIRNHFHKIADLFNYSERQVGFDQKLVAIYNHCQTLIPLMHKFNPSLLGEDGFIKSSRFGRYSISEINSSLEKWVKVYKALEEIDQENKKLPIPFVSNIYHDGPLTDISTLSHYEQLCQEWKNYLDDSKSLSEDYPDEWQKIIEFAKVCRKRDTYSDQFQLCKTLALNINRSNVDPEDAILLVDRIKQSYYCTRLIPTDEREYFDAYFSLLENISKLRKFVNNKTKSSQTKQVRLSCIVLVGIVLVCDDEDVIRDLKIDEEVLQKLDTKQLKKLTESIQSKIKEQQKIHALSEQLLPQEREKLKRLVAKYKKLAGNDANYTSTADHLWKTVKEPNIPNIDKLDITSVKEAISRGDSAISSLERDIKNTRTLISTQLDSEFAFLEKLRHLYTLNRNETEKQAIEAIASKINEQRTRLKSSLTLVDLEKLHKECQQSYNSTKTSLQNAEGYFATQKAEVDKLVTDIKTLVSSHVKNLEGLTKESAEVGKLIDAFQTLPITEVLGTYKKVTTNLKDVINAKIAKLKLDKQKYQETYKNIIYEEIQLNSALSALNKKLTQFKTLQEDVKYPSASKHLFDEIKSQLKILLDQKYLIYVDSQQENANSSMEQQKSSPFRGVIANPLIAETIDELNDLPTKYKNLTKQLTNLAKKIADNEKEIGKAEDEGKKQADKQETLEIKTAKADLRPKIEKLIELQQKIVTTKVDPNSEIFTPHVPVITVVARVAKVGQDENLTITTIRSADALLNQLNNKDQINGFGLKLDNAIKEAEAALKKAVIKQLEDKVSIYNKKLAELKGELKEPVTTPSLSCQKSAKDFTALLGRPEFSKEPLEPFFHKLMQDLFAQPIKNFNDYWAKIEKIHEEAIKALDKEINDVRGKYSNHIETKEQEYSELKEALQKSKEELTEWAGKKHLSLDFDKLDDLFQNIDLALSAKHNGEGTYLTFLDREIGNLKLLETESKDFIEGLKGIELLHQQRITKINQLAGLLKPYIEKYNEFKHYANAEAEDIKEINSLLNTFYLNFGPDLRDHKKNNVELDQIERDVTRLKELLIIANPKLILNKEEEAEKEKQRLLSEKQQLDAAKVTLNSDLDRLSKLTKNLLFLNPEADIPNLTRQMPTSVGDLRTLIASAKTKEDLVKAHQEITQFIETHVTPTVSAELAKWLGTFVDTPYQTTSQLYNSIKEDEAAKNVLTQCELFDRQFEKDIHNPTLLSNYLPRQVFIAISPYYLLDSAIELPSGDFKTALNRLKNHVAKHCAKVDGKINTFKTYAVNDKDKMQENYKNKLKQLEALQVRYLAVQGLIASPDLVTQQQFAKAIEEVKQSKKETAKDYQDAINLINEHIKNLDKALENSITTLLDEKLAPYQTEFKSFTPKELSNAQVPKAVKDLYKLLLLNEPTKLVKLVPVARMLVTANATPFDNWIAHFEERVNQATKALEGEKKQLRQKVQAVEKERQEKESKALEDKQNKILEQAQKEKLQAQSRFNTAFDKFKALKARYDSVQDMLTEQDSEQRKNLAEAIQAIEKKAAEEQYQLAIEQISQETTQLNKLLSEALTKLLNEALEPYKTALKQLSHEDRLRSKVPEAVKKLYLLLLLKVPNHLSDIVPNAKTLTASNNESFTKFTCNLTEYVKNAIEAVGTEKKRLQDEDTAALEKADNDLKKKKQQKLEDEEKTQLEKAQKELEKSQSKYEAELKKLIALKSRYDDVLKLMKEDNSIQQQNFAKDILAITASKKESTTEYQAAINQIAEQIPQLEGALKQALSNFLPKALTPYHTELQKLTDKELTNSQVPKDVKKLYELLLLKVIPKQLSTIDSNVDLIVNAKEKPFKQFIANIENYVTKAANAVKGEKSRLVQNEVEAGKKVEAAKLKKEQEEAKKEEARRKKEEEAKKKAEEEAAKLKKEQEEAKMKQGRKKEEAKKKQETKGSDTKENKPVGKQVVKFKHLHSQQQNSILFIRGLLRQIRAQAMFAPETSKEPLNDLIKKIEASSRCILKTELDPKVIPLYLQDVKTDFNNAIETCKLVTQEESFSFMRYLKVLLGWGNKIKVDNATIEITQADTKEFLQKLERDFTNDFAALNTKKNARPELTYVTMVDTLTAIPDEEYEVVSTPVETPEPTRLKYPPKDKQSDIESKPSKDTSSVIGTFHKEAMERRLKSYRGQVEPIYGADTFLKKNNSNNT